MSDLQHLLSQLSADGPTDFVPTVRRRHGWLIDDGGCTDFLDTDPASVCGAGNANSVHMTGGALCLRPV